GFPSRISGLRGWVNDQGRQSPGGWSLREHGDSLVRRSGTLHRSPAEWGDGVVARAGEVDSLSSREAARADRAALHRLPLDHRRRHGRRAPRLGRHLPDRSGLVLWPALRTAVPPPLPHPALGEPGSRAHAQDADAATTVLGGGPAGDLRAREALRGRRAGGGAPRPETVQQRRLTPANTPKRSSPAIRDGRRATGLLRRARSLSSEAVGGNLFREPSEPGSANNGSPLLSQRGS